MDATTRTDRDGAAAERGPMETGTAGTDAGAGIAGLNEASPRRGALRRIAAAVAGASALIAGGALAKPDGESQRTRRRKRRLERKRRRRCEPECPRKRPNLDGNSP